MKKTAIAIAAIACLSFCSIVRPAYAIEVTDYKPMRRAYYDGNNRIRVAIRSFKRADGGHKTTYLSVDAQSFKTELTDTLPGPEKNVEDELLLKTPYMRAVTKYNRQQTGMENHGIRRTETKTTGIVLTADLCPSKKPLEKDLFSALMEVQAAGTHTGPAPIALAVSGGWIKKHGEELEWIKNEINRKMLDVTWINHSLTHPWDPDKSYDSNFLLTPGINLEEEILGNEALMIKNGIMPTPFFRFPGLISDDGLLKLLDEYSLIPIGSDAWFAKHEYPKPGSIVLLHANGNEPAGIMMFSVYAKKNVNNFRSGSLGLIPLTDAFEK